MSIINTERFDSNHFVDKSFSYDNLKKPPNPTNTLTSPESIKQPRAENFIDLSNFGAISLISSFDVSLLDESTIKNISHLDDKSIFKKCLNQLKTTIPELLYHQHSYAHLIPLGNILILLYNYLHVLEVRSSPQKAQPNATSAIQNIAVSSSLSCNNNKFQSNENHYATTFVNRSKAHQKPFAFSLHSSNALQSFNNKSFDDSDKFLQSSAPSISKTLFENSIFTDKTIYCHNPLELNCTKESSSITSRTSSSSALNTQSVLLKEAYETVSSPIIITPDAHSANISSIDISTDCSESSSTLVNVSPLKDFKENLACSSLNSISYENLLSMKKAIASSPLHLGVIEEHILKSKIDKANSDIISYNLDMMEQGHLSINTSSFSAIKTPSVLLKEAHETASSPITKYQDAYSSNISSLGISTDCLTSLHSQDSDKLIENIDNFKQNFNPPKFKTAVTSRSISLISPSVTSPGKKLTKLLINDVPSTINKEDITGSLEALPFHKSSIFIFIKSIKSRKKGLSHWLFTTDSNAASSLLEKGSITIFSKSAVPITLKLSKYISIIRCNTCQSFGHVDSQCSLPIVCANCSGNHATNSCINHKPCCSNCKKKGYQNFHHYASSPFCPVYQQYKSFFHRKKLSS